MRKWQNLAAPDDPNSWYDVDGVAPTLRGTYERITYTDATSAAATGSSTLKYAFAAPTLTGSREYVLSSSIIWEFAAGAYTARTGGVTIGATPMMEQYGNVTICAMGNTTDTVYSTGGNFAALAGAPDAEIVVTQSNAVLLFNTSASADGWAASDVGDYTNWTTGEAASGRLIATPGPISAAVAFGDSVIVFKPVSIYRMRYVGGTVKWAAELIHQSAGCSLTGSATLSGFEKYSACPSQYGVLFAGPNYAYNAAAVSHALAYWLNDSGQVDIVNPLTALFSSSGKPYIRYLPDEDIFSVFDVASGIAYFFSPSVMAWGKAVPYASAANIVPVLGDTAGILLNRSAVPVAHRYISADVLTRYTPSTTKSGVSYLQSSMYGAPNLKTNFTRVTPLLRVREALGSPVAALTVDFYREREGTAGITQQSVTESTQRRRFDFLGTDNFARFKLTYTDIDFEIDDILVAFTIAGTD